MLVFDATPLLYLAKVEKLHLKNKKLSKADVEVLALAKAENGIAIVDEDYARWVAEVEDIKCGGTIYLILSLLEMGVISKKEAREIVDGIIEKGWFCSTDLYARILRRL
jgi:predicted nucleic acid-binding protein